METEVKFDPSGALRRTILRKLNHQRHVAVSSLAQLFAEREPLRVAVANRFVELANHVTHCNREELFDLQAALHRWKLQAPLSFPSLIDLQRDDYSRN